MALWFHKNSFTFDPVSILKMRLRGCLRRLRWWRHTELPTRFLVTTAASTMTRSNARTAIRKFDFWIWFTCEFWILQKSQRSCCSCHRLRQRRWGRILASQKLLGWRLGRQRILQDSQRNRALRIWIQHGFCCLVLNIFSQLKPPFMFWFWLDFYLEPSISDFQNQNKNKTWWKMAFVKLKSNLKKNQNWPKGKKSCRVQCSVRILIPVELISDHTC